MRNRHEVMARAEKIEARRTKKRGGDVAGKPRKIIRTWAVKLIEREPETAEGADPVELEPPTIDALTERLTSAAADEFGGEWSASAEPTDK
ncbi:MAG: hypothetical protein L0227_05420 [Chloroflexi bacterium]|nr:hypothetical protein [Chloroflexota bacterium]